MPVRVSSGWITGFGPSSVNETYPASTSSKMKSFVNAPRMVEASLEHWSERASQPFLPRSSSPRRRVAWYSSAIVQVEAISFFIEACAGCSVSSQSPSP